MLVTILPGLLPPRLRSRDREREGRALDHRRPALQDQVSPAQVGANGFRLLVKDRHDTQNLDRRTRTKIQALYLKNHLKYL